MRYKRIKRLLSWRKPKNEVEDFFKVLKAMEQLEAEGKILISSEADRPGFVLSHEMATCFNLMYISRMQHYASRYGLEAFFEARALIDSFARKHNPDKELLSLCENVRRVINFRRAAYADGHRGSEEVKADEGWKELKESEPLYITYMNDDLSAATHVGYEINHSVTLEPASK